MPRYRVKVEIVKTAFVETEAPSAKQAKIAAQTLVQKNPKKYSPHAETIIRAAAGCLYSVDEAA
jgi:hypothetical protein